MSSEGEHINNLSVRVLGYREEGKWVAHCLEMDLVAEGDSFEEALSELGELIGTQVGFAIFKGDQSLIFHQAPSWVFEAHALAYQRDVWGMLINGANDSAHGAQRAASIAFPGATPDARFVPANA